MITININNHPVTYELLDILAWLVIGLLAGALATFLTGGLRRGSNLFFELVIGIIGSFLGGFLLNSLGIYTASFVGNLVAATIGAVVLLLIFQAISGGSRRRRRR